MFLNFSFLKLNLLALAPSVRHGHSKLFVSHPLFEVLYVFCILYRFADNRSQIQQLSLQLQWLLSSLVIES